MADIFETVQLSQAVCMGLTQSYSLGGRFRWFLCYTATVLYKNLHVKLDMLKVNFLQIPSMFTTIPHRKRSCWYWSLKFRLPHQIPAISPTECSQLVNSKWQMLPFLILLQHIGLKPMHYCTPSKKCNNYVCYVNYKIYSSEGPIKNCTAAKCKVSWTDSTAHDIRGYIGVIYLQKPGDE